MSLFWDDITIFWDENLLLFTFLTGKLLFTYYHNKLSSQNIVISSQNNVRKYHPDDMKRFNFADNFSFSFGKSDIMR